MNSPRSNLERFSDRAGAYSLYRPGYPAQALDALFEDLGDETQLTVADVGAGTGISTQLLAQRVKLAIAIEPNAAMRSKAAPLSNSQWRDGTAESTGLPDKHVDVAAAFQAFHWFDAPVAFAELTRIARRRIGLLQYERDEAQRFSSEYARVIRPYMLDDTEGLRLRALEKFARLAGGRLRRHAVAYSQRLDLEALLGRVDSSSYLPRTGPDAERLRAEVRGLFEHFREHDAVEMAMICHVLTSDV